MLKNTIDGYGFIARSLHWAMAILILGMIVLGYIMTSMPASDFKYSLYGFHKATGLLIFVLLLFRIIWRFINIQPPLPNTISVWQIFVANLNIFVIYCLMIAVPLTGILGCLLGGHDISFYGLFTLPFIEKNTMISIYSWKIHEIIPYVLLGCVVLHALAAMHHHFIVKNNVFLKMWRGK